MRVKRVISNLIFDAARRRGGNLFETLPLFYKFRDLSILRALTIYPSTFAASNRRLFFIGETRNASKALDSNEAVGAAFEQNRQIGVVIFNFNGRRGSSPNSAAFRSSARSETGTPLSIIIGSTSCLASLILALSDDYDEKILAENRLSVAANKENISRREQTLL